MGIQEIRIPILNRYTNQRFVYYIGIPNDIYYMCIQPTVYLLCIRTSPEIFHGIKYLTAFETKQIADMPKQRLDVDKTLKELDESVKKKKPSPESILSQLESEIKVTETKTKSRSTFYQGARFFLMSEKI